MPERVPAAPFPSESAPLRADFPVSPRCGNAAIKFSEELLSCGLEPDSFSGCLRWPRAVLWSGQIPETSFDPLRRRLLRSLQACHSTSTANQEKLAGHYVYTSLKISSPHSLSGPLMACLLSGPLKRCPAEGKTHPCFQPA